MDERPAIELAAAQAGRVARRQLLGLGWTERQIDWRLRTGRLVRQRPGVYAFAPAIASLTATAWEACLAVGADAALTHVWGAWLRGLLDRPSGDVDVSTATDRGRRLSGVRVHLRPSLPEAHVTLVDGLRVGSVAICLLDLAHRHPKLLPKALNAAQRRMLDVGDLRAFARGRPGCPALLAAMDAYDAREERTREELERLALRMLVERGAPAYEPNATLEAGGVRWEVDGLYRAERLVVELQSEAHHATPAERRQDRAKANALALAGFALVQWDWHDVTHEPEATVRRLLATLATRTGRSPTSSCG